MELETAVEYVAAAYGVVWLVVLAYVWLIGRKITRLEAELDRVEAQVGARTAPGAAEQERESVA